MLTRAHYFPRSVASTSWLTALRSEIADRLLRAACFRGRLTKIRAPVRPLDRWAPIWCATANSMSENLWQLLKELKWSALAESKWPSKIGAESFHRA